MSTQLDRILAHTVSEVASRRSAANLSLLEQRAAAHTPRGFASHLRKAALSGPAIIAELKKASPSRGLIRADFNPAHLARQLEAAGAAALSVLTNAEFFQGSLDNLERASAEVKIPCLRKDFIVDPFQVLEARAAGADAILLIVAAHNDADLKMLSLAAQQMELDVLCEVHDRDELERAVALGAQALGVNSRNLHTMQMVPQTQVELARWLPHDVVRVAESGIGTAIDIAQLQKLGYDAFLVGESLMRHPDPAAALVALLNREYSAL